jgi:hypothetical protein
VLYVATVTYQYFGFDVNEGVGAALYLCQPFVWLLAFGALLSGAVWGFLVLAQKSRHQS